MKTARLCRAVVLMAAVMLPVGAYATNGYFLIGSNLQSMAMGGAGTAMISDAGVASLNPAGAAFVDTQLDFGISLFKPDRSISAGQRGDASAASLMIITPTGRNRSTRRDWPIPQMTFNYRLDPRTSIGVTMYAFGGMNTTYYGGSATFAKNFLTGTLQLGAVQGLLNSLGLGDLPVTAPFAVTCQGAFGGGKPVNGQNDPLDFCGGDSDQTGVDLMQMFIGPYYARQITPTFSVGIEPLFAIQRFEAYGLNAFAKFSNAPGKVSNNGYNWSFGVGVRVGVLWAPFHWLAVGASYQSRTFMTKFEKYQGLFADGGAFDIPPSFNIGLQWHPTANQRILFDYQHIAYSKISSVGNRFDADRFVNDCAVPRLLNQIGLGGSNAPSPACLGAAQGPGFDWQDMDVFKFGYQYKLGKWKLRAGYSHARNPVRQALFSLLAPGVVEQHVTGGLAYRISHAISLNMAVVYAFKKTVSGRNPLSNVSITPQLGSNGNLLNLQVANAGVDVNDQRIREWMDQLRVAVGATCHFD